jgi:carboxymethylenebutenolidase
MGVRLTYNLGDSTGEGYLALPESKSGPAVIVIQEWWGLVGHITDVVDRFASAGFVAFAPDLYHGQAASEPDTAKKLAMELKLDLAGQEISHAADYLLSLPETSTKNVGVVGFCMGGSLAIVSGTLSPKIIATVGFYPGASWERHAPEWYKYAGKSAIFHCAEGDGTSSAPGIQEAITAISSAGGSAIAYDYPGTKHAFFNDDRPEVFDPLSAALAWERTLEFFFATLN